MVVEVARADAQMGGNVIGADIALAFFVEQGEAGIDDSCVSVDFSNARHWDTLLCFIGCSEVGRPVGFCV